ncbi:MAG: hypothetical protein JNN24_03320 [Hyphomicrobium zavarzinii]|jgi:hypothetical protein|uniref:hypothetical protein n=1 Tax=Hyphomicrobium zavarzinii TaxID=48292 RepID=UPI001A476BD8|nr:hypothetical protein [Hyphomicrobium zavarzinii]MBL8844780.1 hypothetical protein [Hyphomicrobium zavarzinii]
MERGLPTDPRVIRALCDTIAGDVFAVGARTLPAIRTAARAAAENELEAAE